MYFYVKNVIFLFPILHCFSKANYNNFQKELIKIKYNVVDYYRDYYLIVNSNNKMALYNKDFTKVIGYEMNYDTLKEYDLRSDYNSINLYKVDGKVVVVNNYLEDKNGIEYDKHNLYIIDGNKITSKKKQVGFGAGDVIYTYDSDYNISFYDSNFALTFKYELSDAKKINNISLVSNNVIMISYVMNDGTEKNIYLDNSGNNIQFNLGDLVISNINYNGYLKENKDGQVLTLYDLEGNYLDDISATYISPTSVYEYVLTQTGDKQKAEMARYFADCKLLDGTLAPGQIRGNALKNDTYFSVQLGFCFVIQGKNGARKSYYR